jgi:hypothetical protein
MPSYRIHLLDSNGAVISHVDSEHDSDIEAIAHAMTLLAPQTAAEVWIGVRCLCIVFGG